MMEKQYDVIVAGAGIGGLGAAGLLARAGKKVLLLEKKNNIGGRAATFKKDGVVRSIGQHAGMENVKYDELLNRLGVKVNKGHFTDIQMTYEGGFRSLAEMFSLIPEMVPEEPTKMLDVLNSDLDLDALDDISAEEFVRSHISNEFAINLIRIGTALTATIPKLDQASAGAYYETAQVTLKSLLMWLAADGMQAVFDDIVDVIKNNGGTVITGMPVHNIIIDNNRVSGVLASNAVEEELIEGEFEEFVEFNAPLVVCNVPVWDVLNNIIPEEILPEDFVKKSHNITERTANLGLTALLPKPVYEGNQFYMVDFPSIDHPGSLFMASNLCPNIVPEGKHLFESSIICNYEELASDQRKKHKMILGMKKDLQTWFPGWDKDADWISTYFHYEEPKRAPGKSGRHRPGNKIDEIEGLYFSGDSYASNVVPGMECAADSALMCVKEILGELP